MSTDSGFDINNMNRKGKFISRINVYSSKDRVLSFPWRKWSNIINLPSYCWLVTSRNGAIFCGSVLVSAVGIHQWL